MKLVKCYISSFGKIKDYTIDFNDGINTIKEDNGWGKSTLAAFIKCMFYGLTGNSRTSIEDNDRKHYAPWNSTEKFGGYLIFEKAGKQFKLQRFFGKTSSDDDILFVDIETGKEYNPSDIGKRVFDIDEQGFFSTVFFSQKEFEIKSNSSITTKYNEVYEIADSVDFDRAISRLEDESKEYSRTNGKAGFISDTKKDIFALTEEISKLQNSYKLVEDLKKQVAELSSDIQKKEKESETIYQEIVKANKVEKLIEGKKSYDVIKAQRDEMLSLLNAPQRVVNGNNSGAKNIDKVNEEIQNYNSCIDQRENIKNDIKTLEDICNSSKTFNTNFLFVLPSILVILGFVLGFVTNWVIGGVCFVLAGLCAFLIFVFGKIKKQNPNMVLLSQKLQQLKDYDENITAYEKAFDDYFSPFNLSVEISYQEKALLVKSSIEKIDSLASSLESLQKEIDRLSANREIFNIPENVKDSESLTIEYNNLKSIIAGKNKELTRLEENIRYYEDDAEKLLDKESKRNELTEKLKELTKEYNVLVKTLEFFKVANNSMKAKYRLPLENSLNKYLSLIDSGTIKAKIDIDLNVSIIENSGEKSTDFYSKGYQNLIEICKRFALIDVLFKKDTPFIILDDPFYNLDESKIKNALSLLDKLKQDHQIIYLICHNSRGL